MLDLCIKNASNLDLRGGGAEFIDFILDLSKAKFLKQFEDILSGLYRLFLAITGLFYAAVLTN